MFWSTRRRGVKIIEFTFPENELLTESEKQRMARENRRRKEEWRRKMSEIITQVLLEGYESVSVSEEGVEESPEGYDVLADEQDEEEG